MAITNYDDSVCGRLESVYGKVGAVPNQEPSNLDRENG